ncbi:polysaccharide deacetylase family protein [Melioribacter sp. OK-6-Me]|uniref:polysaccharide deacetylase family protein n=1 Tax=unclassified Melioribacter TaxID=2627329 RepID=UPI003ED883A5
MKKYLILFLSIFISSYKIFPQSEINDYKVADWFNFKDAAITYTFDDNCANQLKEVVPMFDQYNYKLTLFIVTNWNPDWEGLRKAAANGHEIASHTVSHPFLDQMPENELESELKNSAELIGANIRKGEPLTIAYPYCREGKLSVVKKYYVAARGCQGYIENKTPLDFYNISSIICGSEGPVKTVKDFNDRAEEAARLKGWCVYLLHGIDNDGGYSPLPSDTLRKSLDYLKNNDDRFWVDNFINVVKYIRERNCLTIKENYNNNDTISFIVTDTLNDSIYDFPVTIRRKIPAGWQSYSLMKNNNELASKIINENGQNYIVFNTVPDSLEILLIKNETTNINDELIDDKFKSGRLNTNYPNPFNLTTNISFSLSEPDIVKLTVYDILGRQVDSVSKNYSSGFHRLVYNASKLTGGIYFYTLDTSRGRLGVRKMSLLK